MAIEIIIAVLVMMFAARSIVDFVDAQRGWGVHPASIGLRP